MSNCVDSVNSKWRIKPVELSSWVQIIANEGTGSKCLDVVVGADIVQLWSCAHNQNNQMFEVSQDGYILVKSSGKCLGFLHQGKDGGLPAEGVASWLSIAMLRVTKVDLFDCGKGDSTL